MRSSGWSARSIRTSTATTARGCRRRATTRSDTRGLRCRQLGTRRAAGHAVLLAAAATTSSSSRCSARAPIASAISGPDGRRCATTTSTRTGCSPSAASFAELGPDGGRSRARSARTASRRAPSWPTTSNDDVLLNAQVVARLPSRRHQRSAERSRCAAASTWHCSAASSARPGRTRRRGTTRWARRRSWPTAASRSTPPCSTRTSTDLQANVDAGACSSRIVRQRAEGAHARRRGRVVRAAERELGLRHLGATWVEAEIDTQRDRHRHDAASRACARAIGCRRRRSCRRRRASLTRWPVFSGARRLRRT